MNIPFHTTRGPIDLANLQPSDMAAVPLAEAMAKINRFGGRTPEPWSVAAHSVLVESLCPPDLKPWALLHDAHKVFIGDLTDPAVELLCQLGTRSAVEHAIRNAENMIDRKIGAAWGVAVRSMSEPLRAADQIAFLAEAWTFLGAKPGPLGPAATDLLDGAMSFLSVAPCFTDWRAARDLWLARVEFFAKLGALSPPRSHHPSDMVSDG
jgi:hypothetical protein